jgi:GNAT superfamily N-acetyltransferase
MPTDPSRRTNDLLDMSTSASETLIISISVLSWQSTGQPRDVKQAALGEKRPGIVQLRRAFAAIKSPGVQHMLTVRETDLIQEREFDQLAEILRAVVNDGASVGFLPPLDRDEALAYWRGVTQPDVRLLLAERDGRIVGTAQLALAMKANGNHRAEVGKVLVHPNAQRQGIGRALMVGIEPIARREGRSLLHLDTREGDGSNALYKSLGYIEAGKIPAFARSGNGDLHPTVFYYKQLPEHE